jgi:hypothetical protein
MSAIGITLLAAPTSRAATTRGLARPGWEGSFLVPGLYLVGALLVGAAVIALASRWRRAPRTGTAAASDQLTEFRLLYEKGQMSREEFERVRARLGVQIRSPEPGQTSPTVSAAPAAELPIDAPPAPAPAKTTEAPPAPEAGPSNGKPPDATPTT